MPNGALIAHYQMPRDLCKLWPGVSHRGHGGRKGTDLNSVIAVMGRLRTILAIRENGFEKCYNLKLDWGVSRTAYCMSAGWLPLLLVVDLNSQVVG
jgi:hypothetical protein